MPMKELKSNMKDLIRKVAYSDTYEKKVQSIDEICVFIDGINKDVLPKQADTLIDSISDIFGDVFNEFSMDTFSKKYEIVLVNLIDVYDNLKA